MIIKIPIGNICIVIPIVVYFLKYCNVSRHKYYIVMYRYSPIPKIVKGKIPRLVNFFKNKGIFKLAWFLHINFV